jgi:hypothetical protein
MMLRAFVAATVVMLAPAIAQGAGETAANTKAESCLLNRANGRWVPSAMPDMRRVAGSDASSVIQYAGLIGGISALVTDFRCDHIAYEIILMGPGGTNSDLAPFLAILDRIEKEAGFSSIGKFSLADRNRLETEKLAVWQGMDERGEILLELGDVSTLVRARYVNTQN